MLLPIEILHLYAYDGPNICGPQSGVLLRVRCDIDRSAEIKNALKNGAQFVGMTLAYLDMSVTSREDRFIISANFTSSTPTIGAELARRVVEGIQARASTGYNGKEAGEEGAEGEDEDIAEWDPNAPFFELQQRRRREALPMPALQMVAEARKRDVPVLFLPDGSVQFGYGARGWQFDPSLFKRRWDDEEETAQPSAPPQPPWERIGSIPLYIVTGERQRSAVVQQVAALLRASFPAVSVLDDADYAATLALLADTTLQVAVIGLQTRDILQRGTAFTHCTRSIITDMEGSLPAEAFTPDEWAQALGIPMLLSNSPAICNTADPAIASLAQYAPYGVLLLTDLASGLAVGELPE